MSKISSTISATALSFNNAPVFFEVIVKNSSNDYAAFKISLTAAGADPNIREDWYNLDPISSTLIPPGDKTKFKITILAAPVRGIDLINVEVKVASLNLPDVDFHSLKLLVSPEKERLNIYLPVKSFSIYPRQVLDIPVRVSNLNHNRLDAILELTGLNSDWLERENHQRRLSIGAGKEGETNFTCQPPIVKYAPHGIYSFTIQASVNGREWGQTRGEIKILPIGTVFFSVTPERYLVPRRFPKIRSSEIEPATYELKFKNASNIDRDQITIAVEPRQCVCRVIPPFGTAKAGETAHLRLEVRKKSPWWGLKRKYPLKITPSLRNSHSDTTNPSSQNLELWVQPILPPWLQLGLGALVTGFIIWLLSLVSAPSHSARVNSVTFDSKINPILSASADGTVRQWKASPDNLICQWFRWQRFCLQHQDILLQSLDEVNVVKLRTNNDSSSGGKIAFIGFDSGKVSKLNLQNQTEEVSIDSQDRKTGNSKFNRILDITFSPDLKTVFLGRGTKLSKLNIDDNSSKDLIDPENSIHVLTLAPDGKSIIAGGWANKIFFVELNDKNQVSKPDRREQELILHRAQDEYSDEITGLEFTENNILVTADNRGLIQLWNFNQCEGENCKLLYSNKDKIEGGIGAIALTKYQEKYYLVTGDGGKIKLWSFTPNLETVDLEMVAEIAQYPQKIISIDLIHQKTKSHNRFLILSGSEDNQVRLDTFEIDE